VEAAWSLLCCKEVNVGEEIKGSFYLSPFRDYGAVRYSENPLALNLMADSSGVTTKA
jgi:hypothetical protein